jgi:hypothetical protein
MAVVFLDQDIQDHGDGLPEHLEPNDGASILDPTSFYLDMADVALNNGDVDRFRYWTLEALRELEGSTSTTKDHLR